MRLSRHPQPRNIRKVESFKVSLEVLSSKPPAALGDHAVTKHSLNLGASNHHTDDKRENQQTLATLPSYTHSLERK